MCPQKVLRHSFFASQAQSLCRPAVSSQCQQINPHPPQLQTRKLTINHMPLSACPIPFVTSSGSMSPLFPCTCIMKNGWQVSVCFNLVNGHSCSMLHIMISRQSCCCFWRVLCSTIWKKLMPTTKTILVPNHNLVWLILLMQDNGVKKLAIGFLCILMICIFESWFFPWMWSKWKQPAMVTRGIDLGTCFHLINLAWPASVPSWVRFLISSSGGKKTKKKVLVARVVPNTSILRYVSWYRPVLLQLIRKINNNNRILSNYCLIYIHTTE